MIDYEIEEELSSIGTKGKALKLIKWGSNPAKLDLRPWIEKDGNYCPGRGLTLTDEEAADLLRALKAYFGKREISSLMA